MNFSLDFPRAWGGVLGEASFRSENSDFIVDEDLGFTPSGEGEHIYLHIQKDGSNTQWLAEQLAELVGVAKNDVSYCGLKDRHAITRQWFSIYAPKTSFEDWQRLESRDDMQIKVLQATRGNKKLRRGQHLSNGFKIKLRDFSCDEQKLNELLSNIKSSGVPNYFGEQRFGRECSNLTRAQEWLVEGKKIRSKQQRQLAMSAARAYIFNQVVARRVELKSWNKIIDGDHLENDMATGPMWGRGRSAAQQEAQQIELQALEDWMQWLDGLEHCGLKNERRGLVLMPQDMSWQKYNDDLQLAFSLPPGQFATAVLREIASLNIPAKAVV